MRRLKIVHRTRYEFPETVRLGPHRLLLRPREGHELHIESSLLETSPVATVHWLRDIYDNSVAIASFALPATQLMIDSEVVVQHFDEAPLDFVVADEAVNYPFRYDPDSAAVLRPYLVDVQAPVEQQALRSWLSQRWQVGEQVQTYGLLQRMCVDIKDTLEYQAREYPGVQTAAETLARGAGSCRDFASLFMFASRCLGLAARFVSGYLDTPHTGSGATHAWAEVYLPGAGWKGFDPTLGEMVGSKHIAVAVARRPDVVSPVAGTFFGQPGASLFVDVAVTALDGRAATTG
jgi:transglutaminase-like putative cysteine protease